MIVITIVIILKIDLFLFIQYLFCSEICLNNFHPFGVVKSLKTNVYTRADTILSGDKMHKMWFSCAMKMELFISCDKMQ